VSGYGQLGRETASSFDPSPAPVDLPPFYPHGHSSPAPGTADTRAPESGGGTRTPHGTCANAGAGVGRGGGGVAAAQGIGMSGIYPPPHMTCMCCGEDHVVLAVSDSSVWVWGRGTQGALGLGAQVFFFVGVGTWDTRSSCVLVLGAQAKSSNVLCTQTFYSPHTLVILRH